MMCLRVDYTGAVYDTAWNACEQFFTIMFTVEVICKLYVLCWQYFADNLNNVDFSFVLMAISDVRI